MEYLRKRKGTVVIAEQINSYGDKRDETKAGFGVHISSQRADDLDKLAIEHVRHIVSTKSKDMPMAIDIGCGNGAQSIRMAEAGAMVIAVDVEDYGCEVYKEALESNVAERVCFIQTDLRSIDLCLHFDVIYSQRMIHYLPFHEALAGLKMLRERISEHGRLFLSASGLNSELGDLYPHRDLPVERRYAPLDQFMVEKHAIHGNVCLYDTSDMARLLDAAGFTPIQVTASTFGNIKAVAAPR